MRTTPSRFGALAVPAGPSPPGGSGAIVQRSSPNARELSALESRYPGVVRTLTLLWGHPELTHFLARVAAGLDPRLTHIEPAAMAELMLLGEIHRCICPRNDRPLGDAQPFNRWAGAWRPAVFRG